MLLSRRVEGAYGAKWTPSVALHNVRAVTRGKSRAPIKTFYLYDCRRIRSDAAVSWSLPRVPLPRPAPASAEFR